MSEELETLQRLALTELQAGRIDQTIVLMRKSLSMTESTHGHDSLETAQAMSSLALCLARTADGLTEARELASTAFEIRKTKKGEVDVTTALSAEFLASLETRLGNCKSAENMFNLCLSSAQSLVGPNHINTARIQYHLGLLLSRQDNREVEAQLLLEKSFKTRLLLLGNAAPETEQSRAALSEILTRRIGPAKTEEVFKRFEKNIKDTSNSSALPFQQSMR
jgi:hypothetical protein